MNTVYLKHSVSAGAARLRSGLQTCLMDDDPPAISAHRHTQDSTRSDIVLFTVFGVLVSLVGAWVLYLQTALSRAGID